MPEGYNGAYTGQQIDDGIAKANAALPKAGGVMTGAITLPGDPTEDNHAANKKYVDDTIAELDQQLGDYIPALEKGQNNGVATLDEDGKLSETQKPVYTSEEVGADHVGTAESKVSEHNQSDAAHADLFSAKQNKITGSQGQLVGFDESGAPIAQAAPDVGVTTFNDRTGAVTPQTGDYTAEMVGARPNNWIPSAEDVGAIPASQKGTAGGVPSLGDDGKIPASQLPSYVDDTLEVYVVGETPLAQDWLSLTDGGEPLSPESNKVYLIVSSGEYQNRQYRWAGTQYAEISQQIALGETSSTAFPGDKGKIAYEHSQITNANPHNTTAEQVGARPNTWTPSASDVGAIPSTDKGVANGVATLDENGKLVTAQKPAYSASEVGARPDDWTPSADDVGAIPIVGGTATGKVNFQAGATVTMPVDDTDAANKAYVDSADYGTWGE